ncbi:HORMA domain-containing protein [Drechmeria coniospora]|uniref:HORMA domain-containing protein n=1 Tax=Drechmeria coniospora TaxID=98403 RepID=A0A151GPQ8_DRECN|nr:HORMA domain-containing protein [Drechmeria coniospora]KYK59089.1 HORMA domain-containing protein [Drechmeria coniospora]ODA77852.1 hypothetical protein RJ55_06454 [Drechmeria coniospora]
MSTAVSPSQASAVLTSFTNFLTVALHTLLRQRALYPPATFLLARAYNLPVYQSRHPGVCAWIDDAVDAAAAQLRSGAVRTVALVVHAPSAFAVVERWVFDLAGALPAHGLAVDERRNEKAKQIDHSDLDDGAVNWADVNEAFRGALARLSYAAESMPLPPEESTFTLVIELCDDALPPIEHPQRWIASEPNLQPPTPSNPTVGSALGGASTTPLRSVQAGPLFFECWYEKGKPLSASPPYESPDMQGSAVPSDTQTQSS